MDRILPRKPAAPLTGEDAVIVYGGEALNSTRVTMVETDEREAKLMLRHVTRNDKSARKAFGVLTAAMTALILQGCVTVPAGGEAVQFIPNGTVALIGCQPVGPINSRPPYILPGDDLKQLRVQAVALRADSVQITRRGLGDTQGIAYRCGP